MTAFHVAVIGAGPAGIYTADQLLRSSHCMCVDLFDHHPCPTGLIRYASTSAARLRLFGNIAIAHDAPAGRGLHTQELEELYDAVVHPASPTWGSASAVLAAIAAGTLTPTHPRASHEAAALIHTKDIPVTTWHSRHVRPLRTHATLGDWEATVAHALEVPVCI